MIKVKPCKLCQSQWHQKFQCPYRPHRTLLKRSKPIRRESTSTKQKRLLTRSEWFKANPGPTWVCYLQVSTSCLGTLTKETLILEHYHSKVRRPDLKFDQTNLRPSCSACNGVKLSSSIEELAAKYPRLRRYLND